jgi:hypothetical protein
MAVTEPGFISFTGGKCWDDGWLTLIGKVHGVSQIYIPLAVNRGCSIIARRWVGEHIEVMLNGHLFVATLRAKKKSALVIPLPWSLRGTVGGVVTLRVRPIRGDGHE